jgi:hypothetical protein
VSWKPPDKADGVRSRCGKCGDWQTEGAEHTCPTTGETTTHVNPACPPPKGETQRDH